MAGIWPIAFLRFLSQTRGDPSFVNISIDDDKSAAVKPHTSRSLGGAALGLRLPRQQRVGNLHGGTRMDVFLELQQFFPPGIVFASGPRLEAPGRRWAPASFMASQGNEYAVLDSGALPAYIFRRARAIRRVCGTASEHHAYAAHGSVPGIGRGYAVVLPAQLGYDGR